MTTDIYCRFVLLRRNIYFASAFVAIYLSQVIALLSAECTIVTAS